MKPHDTYLQLAAMAIDYPLAPSDHGRLEAHLAACPACARRASAFRGDALAMGHLPAVILPERRGAEILAAAMHPATALHPLRLLVLAALLGLLLLGSLAVGAQLLRGDDDDLSLVVPPVATQSPGPEASASTGPEASPTPSGVLAVTHGDETGGTWVELVTLGTGAVSPLGLGRDPAWFSDGRLVYACAKAQGENTTICMVDPTEDLQPEIASDATQPAPAPDGSLIAVHRGMIDVGETWIMAADGSGQRLVSMGAFLEWSPDGAWLAGQPESVTAQVAIVGADGQGFRILAPGYDPAWSPSGDRIAFGLFDEQGSSLRTVNVATGKVEILHVTSAGSNLTAPAWLPDGRLLFVTGGNIWLFDAGLSAPVQLTTGLRIAEDGFSVPLAVSPDGRLIAFCTGSGADASVGVASVDGGYRMLDLGDGSITQPQWAPTSQSAPGPDASPGLPAEPLGQTWTQATVPAAADRPVNAISAVTAGGPGFVAVGLGCLEEGESGSCEAVVWTSTDGRTWKRAPVSDATDIGFAFPLSGPRIGMADVAAGTPGIVAIGYAARPDLQAVTWFSPDGASWERGTLGDPASTRVNAVTWDGRSFIAVGEDRSQATDLPSLKTATARAAVWTSADGRTWTRVPHTKVLDVGGFIDTMEDPMTGGMRGVIAGPAGLVAVGSVCQNNPAACQPAVWTSTDGSVWTRADGVPDVPGVLKAIAVSGGRFVAVGAQSCGSSPLSEVGGCPALVLTSPNGQTWTKQPFEQSGDLRTVTAIGDRFFATAPDGPQLLWTSEDGSAWVPAAVGGGPAKPDLGFVVEWQLAATPEKAVWLGPAGMETAPAAWVSGAASTP